MSTETARKGASNQGLLKVGTNQRGWEPLGGGVLKTSE